MQANFWKHLPATLANLKAAVAKVRRGVKAHTPATPQVHMGLHLETQLSLLSWATSVVNLIFCYHVGPFLSTQSVQLIMENDALLVR